MTDFLRSFRTHFYQVAGKSAEARKNIFKTFNGLRDALTRANPTKRSFRVNQEVDNCANELYQAVVDSIEDMILVTSKERTNCK